ncbi:MAG: protein kinase [bacterium]
MIGTTIFHYKVIEELGRGGMGVVYKAEDTRLKREVALKFLPLHTIASEEEKARLEHEAQAAAALDRPNICTVYAINEAEGQTFIAMAFHEEMRELTTWIRLVGGSEEDITALENVSTASGHVAVHRALAQNSIALVQSNYVPNLFFAIESNFVNLKTRLWITWKKPDKIAKGVW